MINVLLDHLKKKGLIEFVILEPRRIYDNAIIGFDEKTNRLQYSYKKMVEELASDYLNNDENLTYSEAFDLASEEITYNVLGSIPNMGKYRPVIFE